MATVQMENSEELRGEMDEDSSEVALEGEVDTESMATIKSSEVLRIIEDEERIEESDFAEVEDVQMEETRSDRRSQSVPGESEEMLDDGPQYRSVSVATIAGPDGTPYRSDVSVTETTEELKLARVETVLLRKQAIQKLKLPIYEVKLERLRGVDKFDAFSEDEEPVLRRDYQPVEKELKCPQPVVRDEKFIVYNVREQGVPQVEKLPRWNTHFDEERLSLVSLPGSLLTPSYNAKMSTGRPSIRKKQSGTVKSRCAHLNENFHDTTPHQRDLFFVSYEELSSKEVAVIKGLWKCITFDLRTFGILTTIKRVLMSKFYYLVIKAWTEDGPQHRTPFCFSLFKLRGYINAQDPKATPDVMMECRFLWPHANHVMEALESVVMNLSRPSVSHKLIHEVGRKHWKLKIPITKDQQQLCVNAFMYTFADHVHPRPNLNEMRTMRKFCSITMFLLADASKWDAEPSIPF